MLLNLLINARQAMPSGGRVLIRLEHDAAADMVDLVVRDTGCGIPADKLPRIFEPFFTTKSGPDETGKGGTGLGLASCRQIIEAHRGRIRVESTVGKGTQFTIKLPVAKQAVKQSTRGVGPQRHLPRVRRPSTDRRRQRSSCGPGCAGCSSGPHRLALRAKATLP